MKPSTHRRPFLTFGAGFIGWTVLSRATSESDVLSDLIRRFDLPLSIPPVLTPTHTDGQRDYYDIVQREARVEIVPGRQTTIWGYNGLLRDLTSPRGSTGRLC
jgi:spore coat protein A